MTGHCVIFATQSARAAAIAVDPGAPDAYRVYIAPLIFGLAPVINTLVSMVWAPKPGEPFEFGLHPPHWILWVGIVCVGVVMIWNGSKPSFNASGNMALQYC